MKSHQYLIVGLLTVLVAGASFFAGTKYQASKFVSNSQLGNRNFTVNQQERFVGNNTRPTSGSQNGFFGGMLNGEITNLDNQTLTIKLADGGSKIIILAESTSYQQNSPASLNSLKIGEKVSVIGSNNTDGSVTARTVSLGENILPLMGRNDQTLPSVTPTE